MALDIWLDKVVYIRLKDGTQFTFSKVLATWGNLINITDRDGLPVTLSADSIEIIREEKKQNEGKTNY